MQINIIKSKAILSILFLALFSINTWSACTESPSGTWTPDTSQISDIEACLNDAGFDAEDTISVTDTTNRTWSSKLTITEGVDLIGPGAGNLTITNGTGDWLIQYSPSNFNANYALRISGFSFDGDSVSGAGAIQIGYSKAQPFTMQTKIRIDNNAFTGYTGSGKALKVWGYQGVAHNNTFTDIAYPIRNNAHEGLGLTWWDSVTGIEFGTANNYMYYEDNTFTGVSTALSDCQYGSRYVFRYNDITVANAMYPMFDMHGNEESGGIPYYSCFGGELYGNEISGAYNIRFLAQRGGMALIYYNNKVSTTGSFSAYVREEMEDTPTDNPQPQHVSDTYIFINRENNTGDLAEAYEFDDCCDALTENSEWWHDDVSFDGSSGVGCGAQATMEAIGTCTEGVGFWATDQSCDDLTNMVGVDPLTPISGTFYRCNDSNTWISYFTPYTYPHPLRSAEPTPSMGGVSIVQLGETENLIAWHRTDGLR